MAIAHERFIVEIGEKRWRADRTHAIDVSIALEFDGAQPNFFGAAPAVGRTLRAGSFVGDIASGGSCNCSSYTLTPHCNGTHTECVGHVTRGRSSVRDIATDHFVPALLISVTPDEAAHGEEASTPGAQRGDRIITRAVLQRGVGARWFDGCRALIVRTLPNERSKLSRNYDVPPAPPPYFSAQAMGWMVEHDIRHLVVDLPSIDRANDAGRLTAHRLFWGLPPGSTDVAAATRPDGTVTEFAYIDSSVSDGAYLLNLQVAPFAADAAPSRPILYPLHELEADVAR